MKNKKRIGGFTLVELLVTIAVISLILVVAGVSVINSIKKTDEKKTTINVDTIKKSATQYIKEFKNSEDDWFTEADINDDNTAYEYACTTVGMLINKGILKENILGTVINDYTVTRNTSVQIKRNSLTKVYSGDISINNDNCTKLDLDSKINITLKREYTDKNINGWYNADNAARIKITIDNYDQIKKSDTNNLSVNNKEISFSVSYKNENNTLVNASSGNDISQFTLKEYVDYNDKKLKSFFIEDKRIEGKDIKICVTAIHRKNDFSSTFCMNELDLYKADRTSPSSNELKLQKNNNEYILKAESKDLLSGIDTFKSSSNIESKSGEFDISSLSNYDEDVKIDVYDNAGNKSSISKNLIINMAENEIPQKNYYCNIDPNSKNYLNYDDANNKCYEMYEHNKIVYDCSLNNYEYESMKDADDACIKTGTISKTTSCPSGYYLSGSSCRRRVDGWVDSQYICTEDSSGNLKWHSNAWPSSNYGCGSDTKIKDYCDPEGKRLTSCSSKGSTTSELRDCYNICESSSGPTTSCYCSITGSDSCSSSCTETGTVSSRNKTIYNYNNNEYSKNQLEEIIKIKNKYYCSIDNKYHDNLSSAQDACTNYCKPDRDNKNRDPYLNNKCYYLY